MRIQHGAIALALLLAVALAVVVLLPDFVRGRLEDRIEALTSRATTIADVDLDLFARRLVVHDLRVHGTAGEPSLAAVTRIDARFHRLAFLVRGAYVLDSAEIVRPVVHVVRTDADRFNVSALLDRLAEPDRSPSVSALPSSARRGASSARPTTARWPPSRSTRCRSPQAARRSRRRPSVTCTRSPTCCGRRRSSPCV
jgi:hypothetical protein